MMALEVAISYLKYFFDADFANKLVLLFLAGASVYVWKVIFQKLIYFAKLRIACNEFRDYVYKMPQLKRLIVEETSLFFEVYDGIFDIFSRPHAYENREKSIQHLIDSKVEQWGIRMERNLEYLSMLGSITPFVGLFGTVLGIMRSFQAIASTNSSNISVVAPGIAEALFATAVGLFVAIPCVAASVIFYAKIEKMEKDLHQFADHIIKQLEQIK